jgi:hypothetical protein
MDRSFRAWFLIIVACVVSHLSGWSVTVIFIGYGIAEYVDQWWAKKAREEILDDLLFGWEPSKDEPEHEEKGGLSRVRLTANDQILAARIAELLVRMR